MKSALIVEDEKSLQEIYKTYFDYLKFGEILVPEDSLDAFMLATQRKFSIIVLDYRMPIINGGVFLKKLRQNPGPNQHTPVLFISGYIAEVYQLVQDLNNTIFLDKPVKLDTFTRNVNMLVPEAAS